MQLFNKLIGFLIGAAFEGLLSPRKPDQVTESRKKVEPESADSKWRRWRIERDEELEARKTKNISL
jgi:hypothetical protein